MKVYIEKCVTLLDDSKYTVVMRDIYGDFLKSQSHLSFFQALEVKKQWLEEKGV